MGEEDKVDTLSHVCCRGNERRRTVVMDGEYFYSPTIHYIKIIMGVGE